MPRPKKVTPRAPVIPSNSLVASAARYEGGKAARVYQPNKDWQHECYRHYAICGEARFAARFFGHALSRAVLGVEQVQGNTATELTKGTAFEFLEALFNGRDGQEQMLEAIGIHFTIAGECYLVGRQDEEGNDLWEIVSPIEMQVTGSKWSIKYGDGIPDVPLRDEDTVIRMWLPNPARRIEADSPFRSLLPILTEIEFLTRHIFAQTQSRLAGAGVWVLPQSITFPPPPPIDGKEQAYQNEAEGFMVTLANSMMKPIEDPSSPSALVPIIIQVPDDAVSHIKDAITFWSELDQHALEMRSEAIRRFALGMELPPEQVLGMSSNSGTGGGTSNGVSHWGAWQIEESTIKMFVEPMLSTVTNALTIGYLRPLLNDDSTTYRVSYSTAALRLRPDRSQEAFELWDRGELSSAALLREVGFKDIDAPEPEERKQWLIRKVASGSATPEQVGAALRLLGVDLGIAEESTDAVGREARPAPSLEEHPREPRTPDESALVAACDALVYRALERAGNRLRQNGVRPTGVPSFETHVFIAGRGKEALLLDDAWSCAPQVLDGLADPSTVVPILNSYVSSLIAMQTRHDRTEMAKWLRVRREAS